MRRTPDAASSREPHRRGEPPTQACRGPTPRIARPTPSVARGAAPRYTFTPRVARVPHGRATAWIHDVREAHRYGEPARTRRGRNAPRPRSLVVSPRPERDATRRVAVIARCEGSVVALERVHVDTDAP